MRVGVITFEVVGNKRWFRVKTLVIERGFTIVGVSSLGGNFHMWERGSLKLMKVTLG